MYVEPCCIDRQLSELLRHRAFAFFQASGDCTAVHFLNAVSAMAEGVRVLLMVIPEVDIPLLRVLRHYFVQNWYEGVILLTREVQTEMIRNELEGFTGRVAYGCNQSVTDGFFTVLGSERSVCVQGPLLLAPDFTTCAYAAYKGNDKELLTGALDTYLPKTRLSALIEPEDERVSDILSCKI